MEPSWNLTSGLPRNTPEPIWAETPKLPAVGEKHGRHQLPRVDRHFRLASSLTSEAQVPSMAMAVFSQRNSKWLTSPASFGAGGGWQWGENRVIPKWFTRVETWTKTCVFPPFSSGLILTHDNFRGKTVGSSWETLVNFRAGEKCNYYVLMRHWILQGKHQRRKEERAPFGCPAREHFELALPRWSTCTLSLGCVREEYPDGQPAQKSTSASPRFLNLCSTG